MYVTNGVFRDVIDRDANTAILQKLRENGRKPTDADFLAFTQMLPQQKMTNYFFKNKGNLHFENVSSTWTDSIPTFSNGAVYADLDNDGDLDIVVNNINSEASVLKNTASDKDLGKFVQIKLKGPADNLQGIGTLAKITLEDGSTQVRQMINARGFLSAVSGTLHFGLKNSDDLASLEVIWPDDTRQVIPNPAVNQVLSLDYKDADQVYEREPASKGGLLFSEIKSNFEHIDPAFNDYSQQILLPHKLSQTGPAACKGDVNGDGLEDVFIGGGHTQAGQLLLATTSGKFRPKSIPDFARDRQKEDVGAVFFDADQDQDLDLYVVSGSYEFAPTSKLQADRLYLNDGKGNFTKTRGIIPEIPIAGSVIAPADFDKDGDIDLFVGARVIPGAYPYAPESLLLRNEDGKFSSVAQTIAPELAQIGMVNDAIWEDMDGDDDLDLILTGEWMGIEVFINERGKLARNAAYNNLSENKGWWNKLLIADIDQDGDKDIVAGNLGLNYKFHASPAKPFHIYTHDFDFNGSKDVILAKYYKDTEVPVRGKTCAIQQIPHLAQKIPTFNDFASRDLEGILGPGLKSALHYEATEFRSGIFLNQGEGNFEFSPFGFEAQQSPINSILYQDFDKDGKKDLLLAGNNYMSEIETTRADAGIGVFLKGKEKGEFRSVPHTSSGFFADKDVRAMLLLNASQKPIIFVVNNNDKHTLFSLINSPNAL